MFNDRTTIIIHTPIVVLLKEGMNWEKDIRRISLASPACIEERQWILLHAVNDALNKTKGCIAPVSFITMKDR